MSARAPGILLIAGSGHSGSTVLDMTLGRRQGLVSLGEVDRLGEYAGTRLPCTCGAPFEDCAHWGALLSAAAPGLLPEGDPLSLRLPEGAGDAWAVDSSKGVGRARALAERAPGRVRILHLTRDGRGVLASRLARGAGPVEEIATHWARTNERALALTEALGPSRARRLSYEAFCTAPEAETEAILAWLDPALAGAPERRDRRTHNIAGNRARFRFHRRIRRDDSWRDRLGDAELKAFERAAGPLNRRLLGEA